jgi:hypothetical protein
MTGDWNLTLNGGDIFSFQSWPLGTNSERRGIGRMQPKHGEERFRSQRFVILRGRVMILLLVFAVVSSLWAALLITLGVKEDDRERMHCKRKTVSER